MLEVLESFSNQIGMNLNLFIFIIIWTAIWKLIGLWHSARKNQPLWFIAIAILNTIGVLPILYLFIFKDLKSEKKSLKKELVQKKISKKSIFKKKK
jgi:hypothetical protein